MAAVTGAFDGGDRRRRAAALKADRFDRDRAFADLRHQVELGPRPAGSRGARASSRRWLRDAAAARALRGRARAPGCATSSAGSRARKPAIVVAAHYDTKDLPGFVGANDGAGGTAAVLELARALQQAKRPAGAPPIRFVLFDGEEATDDSRDFYATGLRGSKAYARAPRRASCAR